MKYIRICILVLIFALFICETAFALGYTIYKTYDIEDIEISIDIPSNYIVITRDTDENDPNLRKYELTKSAIDELFLERNIYLDCWDEDATFEVTVTTMDSSIADFSSLGDNLLSVITSIMKKQYDEAGYKYIKSDIYKHKQTKFVKIYAMSSNTSTDNGIQSYILQYLTSNNGKLICITLNSNYDIINDKHENVMTNIVNSINFYNAIQTSNLSEEYPAFIYTDSQTGLTFTVPEGWAQRELIKEREYVKAAFESKYESGYDIIYSCTDAWSNMNVFYRLLYSRNDLDEHLFTKEKISEILDVDEASVTKVSFGLNNFYRTYLKESSTEVLNGITIEQTCICTFSNGYMYSFILNSTSRNREYEDLGKLLMSIKYPQIKKESGFDTEGWWKKILINLLLTIIVHPVPILIFRYLLWRKPVSPRYAMIIIIVDAIVVLFIWLFINYPNLDAKVNSIAIAFWSGICYRSLKSGYQGNGDSRKKMKSKKKKHKNSKKNKAKMNSDIKSRNIDLDEIKQISKEKAVTSGDIIIDEDRTDRDSIKYCRYCGSKLTGDSIYCERCGRKVRSN